MQLLNPAQKVTASQEQTLKTIMRTQELEKAAANARVALATAEAEFNATLARNRIKWATEEEEHFKRVKEREAEITVLESRKQQALIPIEAIIKEAKDGLDLAKERHTALDAREAGLEIVADNLQDKLDKVGEQEQDNKQRAVVLDLREQGIERQSATAVLATKQLNTAIAEFTKYKESVQLNLAERQKDLDLIGRSLQAKQDMQKRTDEALNALAIQLKDERENVQKAWDELRRKEKALSP